MKQLLGRCVFSTLVALLVGTWTAPAQASRQSPDFSSLWRLYDDFERRRLPGWDTAAGQWGWRPTGGGAIVGSGDSTNVLLSLNEEFQSFRSGVIKARVRFVPEGYRQPNAAVLFSYVDRMHYRYAKVARTTDGRWLLTIGQVGEFPGATAGVKARQYVTIRPGEWFELGVHLYGNGGVTARVKGVTSFYSVQKASHVFPRPVPGRLGLRTQRSAAQFDRFRAFEVVAGVRAPLPALEADDAAVSRTSSIRIMTHNVQMLPPFLDPEGVPPWVTKALNRLYDNSSRDKYLTDDDDRAAAISASILSADIDVIALNEVFSEQAREEFVKWLSPFFKSYVYELPGNLAVSQWGFGDSGLMLFSRHKFIPLSKPDFMWPFAKARNRGNDWHSVAFKKYEASLWPDLLAIKGCALVRLATDDTESFKYTVVFTHTQATYETDPESLVKDFRTRKRQMEDCRQVIMGSLKPNELAEQPLFMVGDLNIDGNRHGWDLIPGIDKSEWFWTFGSGYTRGNFYGCMKQNEALCPGEPYNDIAPNLVDSQWWETNFPLMENLGRTQGNDLMFFNDRPDNLRHGERLDYVLRNLPDDSCGQHVRVGWTPAEKPHDTVLSDHLPLLLDYNLMNEKMNCTPRRAKDTGFTDQEDSPVDRSINGWIRFAGGMEWFTINAKGTYNFTPTSGVTGYEVYHHSDLSRPLKAVQGPPLPREGKKYLLGNPPYYVRIFKVDGVTGIPDRKNGNFWSSLNIHKCKCTNREEDVCVLPAGGDAQSYIWPNTAVNEDDTIYYTFQTDRSDRGEYPTVEGVVATPPAGNPYLVPDVQMPVTYASADCVGSRATGLLAVAKETCTHLGVEQGHWYFLAVQRQPDGDVLTPGTSSTFLKTNLTYFVPKHLVCYDRQDGGGHKTDEIYQALWNDEPGDPGTFEGNYSYLHDFGEETNFDLGSNALRYLREVTVGLMEDDDTSDPDYLGSLHLVGLSPSSPGGPGQFWFKESDAEYLLWYELRHEP